MKAIKKKGQVTQYILFFAIALVIIVIASIFAPMGTLFNIQLLEAGEDILLQAQDDVAGIQDATIRAQVNETLNGAIDSAVNNIAVNNSVFQWGWVAVVLVFFITLFIITRKQVEVSNQFGGGFV